MKYKNLAKKLSSSFFLLTLFFTGMITLSSCGELDSSGQKTLTILSSSSNIHLDPATSQNLNITTLGLITRRLTAWNVPKDGSQVTVQPDLATSLGVITDGGKTVTYHLKDGIKFETGQIITSKDIKWGLERSFADELTGGLSLHKDLLKGGSDYTGPFAGKELDSIETPDDSTIVFHLVHAYGDWDWVASTPAFSPVPYGNTQISEYDSHPIASGPYKVKEYETGVKLTLDKNPYWNKDTDSFRLGDSDQIVTYLGQSADVATDRLMADQGEDQQTFASSFVAPQKLAQISSQDDQAKRLVTSQPGALRFLSLNNSRYPLNNKALRVALQYAVDKNAVRIAKGGEIAGDFASTLITPGIEGRQEYNLYPADPSGDINKALQILKDANIDPKSINLKLVGSAQTSTISQAIAQGIERTGIKVTIKELDEDSLFDLVTSGKDADYDLYVSGWQPDIPTAFSNIQPLYASNQIGHGNYNTAQYSNKEVDRLIEKVSEETDSKKANQMWAELDKKIMEDAPVVPLIFDKNTWLIGSKIKNFYIGSFPAYPNYLQVTVDISTD